MFHLVVAAEIHSAAIKNHPVAIAPGHPAAAAKSEMLRYQDFGFEWSLSGKNGFYSPFNYQGP